MRLHDLKPAVGARRARKRVGRGPGSGTGKTSGRGHNGQKSRCGYKSRPGFEGGQMSLARRLPKRGFHNIFRTEYRTVNVDRLNDFEAGSILTPEVMQQSGLLKKGKNPIKILGDGELTVKLTIQAHKFSRTAAEKIEAAGGTIERLGK